MTEIQNCQSMQPGINATVFVLCDTNNVTEVVISMVSGFRCQADFRHCISLIGLIGLICLIGSVLYQPIQPMKLIKRI
jgi:hypothetical protein